METAGKGKGKENEKAAVEWSTPLKVPATEIMNVPLDGEDKTVSGPAQSGDATRDASDETGGEDENEDEAGSSLWEEILEIEGGDGQNFEDEGGCTVEETVALKKRLRAVGEREFYNQIIKKGQVPAKKVLTAFGVRPPVFLEGLPDHVYYPILELAICRELAKRVKLAQYNTLDDAVQLLKNSSKIIVLTGAGISTSLGIPDFRSKETGLYSQLEHLGLSDPQEVFDLRQFIEDPSIFYSVAKDILPSSHKFSPTHAFIRLLQDKSKLLTNFTQNIDNLESHAGISPKNLIQCHGSFATATCTECRTRVPGDSIYEDLKAGQIARCKFCLRQIQSLDGMRRKRSSPFPSSKPRKRANRHPWSDSDSAGDDDDEADSVGLAGVMKPDITFFGEDLPSAFHDRLVEHDRDKVDLVLVIGTSLKVAPVSEVVGVLPDQVPRIYINRDPCHHVEFDIDLLGECDTVVAELCRRAGWEFKHEMCKEGQKVTIQKEKFRDSRWYINAEK